MNTKNVKASLIGLGVLTALSLGGNVYLFTQLDGYATASKVATLSDQLIELDTALSEQSTTIDDEAQAEFLLNNPEAIIKSLTKYRFEQEQLAKAQQAETIKSLEISLTGDANDPILGNPNGSKVIVEFVDYNCGYCKNLSPVLERVMSLDPEVKVVIKEFPIFKTNPSSAYSALIGTALFYHSPVKYAQYHKAAMGEKRLTTELVDQHLSKLGVTKAELKPYLDRAKKQVEKNRVLGAQLNVGGTPTLFINGERVAGNLSTEQYLQALSVK